MMAALAMRGVDTTPYMCAVELGQVDPVDNAYQYAIEYDYTLLSDYIDNKLRSIQLYRDGVKLCDRRSTYLNQTLLEQYLKMLYHVLKMDGIHIFNDRYNVPVEAVDNASQLMWQWYTVNHETIHDFTYRFINQC